MTQSLDNDNKKPANPEPDSPLPAELRQWLMLKFLRTLDMLAENRNICLRTHAASEKESASLMKEANQAIKISLDVLERLLEFCKTPESSGGPSANEASAAKQARIEALKRKIRDNMRGIGNNDTQTELW